MQNFYLFYNFCSIYTTTTKNTKKQKKYQRKSREKNQHTMELLSVYVCVQKANRSKMNKKVAYTDDEQNCSLCFEKEKNCKRKRESSQTHAQAPQSTSLEKLCLLAPLSLVCLRVCVFPLNQIEISISFTLFFILSLSFFRILHSFGWLSVRFN